MTPDVVAGLLGGSLVGCLVCLFDAAFRLRAAYRTIDELERALRVARFGG